MDVVLVVLVAIGIGMILWRDVTGMNKIEDDSRGPNAPRYISRR